MSKIPPDASYNNCLDIRRYEAKTFQVHGGDFETIQYSHYKAYTDRCFACDCMCITMCLGPCVEMTSLNHHSQYVQWSEETRRILICVLCMIVYVLMFA